MSEITGSAKGRRLRADAERSMQSILDSAVQLLNERPGVSVEELASAAGVTRQTVYAHYPSREALITAAIDHVTSAAVAEMNAVNVEERQPSEALMRMAQAGWKTYLRYPRLLQMAALNPDSDRRRHDPVREQLEHVIARGQSTGDFDPDLPTSWLATLAMTLGHAAAEDVANKRITTDQATHAIEKTLLRVVQRR